MGRPVTVHLETLSSTNADAQRRVAFLHGILGTGANWRSIARRLIDACPAWHAALVDLPLHGRSHAHALNPPTVHTSAQAVSETLSTRFPETSAIVGHSFGGKIGLEIVASLSTQVKQLWLTDSRPTGEPRGSTARDVYVIMKALGKVQNEVFAHRNDFRAALGRDGLSPAIAQWLSMQLEATPDGVQLAIDLSAIEAVLADYEEQDYWSFIENAQHTRVHCVLGARSDHYKAADKERLGDLATRFPERVFAHTVENAGHWVNADNPAGLLSIMTPFFNAP